MCPDAQQHFGGLEGGQEISLERLAKQLYQDTAASVDSSFRWPHPRDYADLPTVADVQRLLVSAPSGKAPGFDGLPAELGKRFAKLLAPHLWRSALKTGLRGAERHGFKSGQTVWFYKGRGPMDSCASFRAILLLPVWAKTVHQALRPPLKRHYEQQAPSLQLGGRSKTSVVFGSHLIRAAARVSSAIGQTHFTLFTDIASAFYTVIKQLVARHTVPRRDSPCLVRSSKRSVATLRPPLL